MSIVELDTNLEWQKLTEKYVPRFAYLPGDREILDCIDCMHLKSEDLFKVALPGYQQTFRGIKPVETRFIAHVPATELIFKVEDLYSGLFFFYDMKPKKITPRPKEPSDLRADVAKAKAELEKARTAIDQGGYPYYGWIARAKDEYLKALEAFWEGRE